MSESGTERRQGEVHVVRSALGTTLSKAEKKCLCNTKGNSATKHGRNQADIDRGEQREGGVSIFATDS